MNQATLNKVKCKPSAFLHSARRWVVATAVAGIFAIGLSAAVAGASPLPQTDPDQAPMMRERVLALPPHTMVQVRLHNRNLKGRVRVVTRKGFVLEFTSDGKSRNEKISYDDVQSLQPVESNGKGSSFSIHVVIGDGSGGGVDVQIDR